MMFNGKKVLVVGLGKSGLAAARLLRKRGARVFLTEQKLRSAVKDLIKKIPAGVSCEMGSHRFFRSAFDLIVVSPGVPWDQPDLVRARKKGIPVWPELELGWRCVSPAQTIAITGTNGKTTTTALIGHVLEKAGRPVAVGGNIGRPLCEFSDQVTSKTFLVLEVSSYQLEGHETFHPNVGLVLNVTPDHLKRHGTMSRYTAAKGRVFANATPNDVAVLNRNDAWCRKIGKRTKARKVWFPSSSLKRLAQHIRLPGQHNLENAMAAVGALKAVGLSDAEIKSGLVSFKGVKHRIQFIATKKGVHYFNDSKGTNVDSTVVALKALTKPVILILGGQDKGSPYKPLIPLIKKKVRDILTIGEAHPLIARDLKGSAPITSCRTLENAIRTASEVARKGDSVLLSPACASFDQYKNFEERGDHFIKLVQRLKK